MIAIYGIVGAVVILTFWAFILWIGARVDRPHLEREQFERVFLDDDELQSDHGDR